MTLDLWESYKESQHRYLEAMGRSEHTFRNYRLAVTTLEAWCVKQEPPIDNPILVRRDDIIAWIASLRERGLSKKYIHNTTVAMHTFYAWLIEDGELGENPVAGLMVKEPPPE